MANDFEKFSASIKPQIDQFVSEATAHAKEAVDDYLKRAADNLSRCRDLLDLHATLKPHALPGGEQQLDDLLRAVVVLMHASLEDLLRTVASARLPLASAEVLNKIPFADTNRATKISLGHLAAHRGQSVDQIIDAAVSEYLSRESFNSSKDIMTLLAELNIDAKAISNHLPALDAMTKRRHQIVHTADRGKSRDVPEPIAKQDVEAWLDASMAFTIALLTALGLEAVQKKIFGK